MAPLRLKSGVTLFVGLETVLGEVATDTPTHHNQRHKTLAKRDGHEEIAGFQLVIRPVKRGDTFGVLQFYDGVSGVEVCGRQMLLRWWCCWPGAKSSWCDKAPPASVPSRKMPPMKRVAIFVERYGQHVTLDAAGADLDAQCGTAIPGNQISLFIWFKLGIGSGLVRHVQKKTTYLPGNGIRLAARSAAGKAACTSPGTSARSHAPSAAAATADPSGSIRGAGLGTRPPAPGSTSRSTTEGVSFGEFLKFIFEFHLMYDGHGALGDIGPYDGIHTMLKGFGHFGKCRRTSRECRLLLRVSRPAPNSRRRHDTQ